MPKGPGPGTRCGWHEHTVKTGKVKRPPRRWGCPWTPAELDILGDNYGLMSDKALASRLGRTRNGIIIAAKRKLQVNRKQSFYTAHEVATLLGCRCSKTVIYWVSQGWLKGKQGPVGCGVNLMWQFSEEELVSFLQKRPWIVDRACVRRNGHYFASVLEAEWKRDRWYTVDELLKILAVGIDAVHRYIRRGWLPAVRKPGGPHQGRWIVRKSSLDQFIANDPRPLHRRRALAGSRRTMFMDAGRAVRVCTLWRLRCPKCGDLVEIIAAPDLHGPVVRERFVSLWLGPSTECSHGKTVGV